MKELIQQLADKLYCLNLEIREDKRLRSQEVFDANLLDVEFIPAISGEGYETTDRMLANYKAQNQGMINIFQNAIDNNYSMIGIFEDDIEFSEDAKQILSESLERTTEKINLVDDLTKPIYGFNEDTMLPTDEIVGYEQKQEIEMIAHLPDNWDCFTLGCLNRRWKSTIIAGRVHKLRHADLGHCWFFKASMFQPMIDELSKMTIPYDTCISTVFGDFDNYNAYGILGNGIAYQRTGVSDNLERTLSAQEVD